MLYLEQDPQLATEDVELNLEPIYGLDFPLTVKINSNFPHLVIDTDHTIISFAQKPILVGNYYHPQPFTDFLVIGQLVSDETPVEPLPVSHYLSCVIS